MDLHALSRRDLQALAKRNGVKANMTNAAMADALAALPAIDGIEEYVQQPVAEPAPAAEPDVQAAVAEEEKKTEAEEEEEQEAEATEEKEEKGEPEKQGISSHEVIMLDDTEDEEKGEEKAPALGMGRRRATRRARTEPVAPAATRKKAAASKAETEEAEPVAPAATRKKAAASKADTEEAEPVAPAATRKKAAASKADTEEAAAAEAMPSRATRARSQKTVSWADEEAPKARTTTRRAAARKTTGTEKEEEEEGTRSGVSDAEAAVPAPASSDEGNDGADEIEAVVDAQNEEQVPAAEPEKGDAAVEAVPARATRARGRRTVVSVPVEEAPKARRMSRRSVATKASTEQEDKENGDASDTETAAPAPVSSNEQGDGAEEMEVGIDAHNEEENHPVEEPVEAAEPQVAVPARTTRTRSKRTVVPVADEEAPKARRTTRRAVTRNSSTEQEDQEKGAQGDVSDMEVAAPAPVSSEEGGHDAEEVEAAMDVQKDEQIVAAEAEKENAAAETVPVRATRGRSKRTVVPVAEEEAPKARRTTRRAAGSRTSTEQEEEEKGTQGDVSDMGAAVSAPTSSDVGGAGAEEIEATVDAQKEEQFAAAEAVPARATRARRQRPVESVAEEEAPKARRTSRRTGTKQEEKVQCQQQQDIASDVEAAVPEEMEAAMEPLNEEQNELVEEESDEGVVVDSSPLLEEEQPVAEYCQVDSSVEEQTGTVSSEEIQHSSEDTEMVPVHEKLADENEECTVEEDCAADSAVQDVLVDVQQCEATEEIHLASEEDEMVVVNEVPQVDHSSEKNDDCTVEEELHVAEDVQQCEATEEIDVVSEEKEDCMVQVEPVAEDVQQCEATGENEDCTVEEEPAVAEHVDSAEQEALVDVKQCEATEEIQLAGEDAEMVTVNEVPQVTLTSGEATVETEDCTVEEETPLADDVQQCEASEEKKECMIEEEPEEEDVQEIQLGIEDAEMVHVNEVQQVTVTCCTAEETEDCTAEEEPPVEEHVDSSVQELLDIHQSQDAEKEEIPLATEDAEMVPLDEVETDHADEEKEECVVEEDPVAEDVLQCEDKEECKVEEELPVAENVQQCDATEDVHLAGEDTEMVHVNEVLLATLNSVEVTEEVDFTSDAGEENEVLSYEEVLQSAAKASEKKEDMAAEEETLVATDEMPRMSEAMDVGAVEVVTVDSLFATVTDDESGFSCDLADASVEDCAVDSPVEEQHGSVPSEEIRHSSDESGEATEEVDFTSDDAGEETEDCTVEQEAPEPEDADSSVQELLLVDVEQCQNSPIILGLQSKKIHSSSEYTEMVPQATLTSSEEVGCANESALQSAAKASKEKEEMVAVEVQQWSEAMYEEVVEVVTVDKDESWFIPDLAAVFMDVDAAVADDEMPQSSATMEEHVEEVVAVKESGFACDQADVSVEEEENVEEVDQAVTGGHTPVVTTSRDFSDHITSPFSANVFECASKSLSTDSITVEQSGFTSKLMDMSVEEQGVVAADEVPQSSATLEENVEEEVVAFENLPQVTVTDDEWAVTLGAWLENMSQVKEMFTFDSLLQDTLTEDEEAAVADDTLTEDEEMLHSSATKVEENVEEVVTVENLGQAKESGVVLQPVVDTASDHTPSPQSANVFQNATKYLSSMDSITAKPTVSEPADVVPLCVYIRSARKLKITEPMSVQREKVVAKKPEALGSVSVRRLKMNIKADDAPLCIYGDENNTSEAQASEALGSRSLRKLRTEFNEIVAAQENEANKKGKKPSTPLDTLSMRQLRRRLKETLNAQSQKNTEQPSRVPLGRLDENAW